MTNPFERMHRAFLAAQAEGRPLRLGELLDGRSAPFDSGPAGPVRIGREGASRRFRLACRMLRQAGHFDRPLPGQRPSESHVDWLVRFGLASSPHVAADMLIHGAGLAGALDELLELPDVAF